MDHAKEIQKQAIDRFVADMNKPKAPIEDTLAERNSRYGGFQGHAEVTQNIKRAMQNSKNWTRLSDDMKESLDMLAHKLGRILNGDPYYKDSWHDAIGYLTLIERNLVE